MLLSTWLKQAGKEGGYLGLPEETNLFCSALDDQISVRYQTTFVPENCQFDSLVYNYQTQDSDAPRNLILYSSTQGVALHQDMPGGVYCRQHKTLEDGFTTNSYHIKASSSNFEVGSNDHSSSSALPGESFPAAVFGTKELGTRQNIVMTIHVPLKVPERRTSNFGGPPGLVTRGLGGGHRFVGPSAPRTIGKSSAARLSLGELAESNISNLAKKGSFERDPSQRITVTIIAFNAVRGGVPSLQDVTKAAQDTESLFDLGKATKRSKIAVEKPSIDYKVKDVLAIDPIPPPPPHFSPDLLSWPSE